MTALAHSTDNLGKDEMDISMVATPCADGEGAGQISTRYRMTHHGRLARGIAATILTIGLASIPSMAEARPAPLEGESSAPSTGLVTRADLMLARASTWLTANNGKRVPYSQSHYWDEDRRKASPRAGDGYRQDCSGFVAMAAKLRKQPNTQGLYEYTNPISTRKLKPGDLLIDRKGGPRSRHVVIFEKWANKAHTEYWAFEQRGGHGTDHTKRKYGLVPGDEYEARRLKNIVA